MANKSPSPSTRFKKGQSGNPKGPTPLEPEVKQFRQMTMSQVAQIGAMIINGDVTQLNAVIKSPTSTVLEVWIASCAVKGISRGDSTALNQLLDRFVGKIPAALLVKEVSDGITATDAKAITFEIVGKPVDGTSN